ncbi:sensor histidine kinase [Desertivirga arenae]|uniref:sensor histidine kinase n=1 Tax=Desertivirga arenae TaxID=2810309 RepID=UPI001A962505|nr:sensor histidine kinase [Pedobacter sp. SYSU D00823]
MRLSTLIFLGFSVVIVLSLVDSYVNNLLSDKVNQNIVFLTRSEAVIRNSSRLHKSIIEMQSGFRGYLLTDEQEFLQPYFSGLKVIPRLFNEQRALIKESDVQSRKLDSIARLHQEWINYANSLIEAKKESLEESRVSNRYQYLFENKLRKQVGKKINDNIASIFRRFDRLEYQVRENRRDQLLLSIDRTKTFSFIFSMLTVAVGVMSGIYIVLLISRRIKQMVNLAESISKGQFILVKDNKNDELTSLSNSLNIMSTELSKNISELEKRNRELNQFAYVVSHDLKAPIRGIYNVVQWIEEDLGEEISSEMRKYLNIIPQRINRMEDLIHGLLDYARISRDKPVKEVVDVNIMLQGIAEMLVPESFRLNIDKMPVLFTEKIRLEQVFSNLISNAVKYSKGENPAIEIQSEEKLNAFQFKVIDNGIGIDPQYHSKIFEIFQTLREKHDKESTGIGLAIVKRIIEEKQSTIKVESEPGKGTAFIFTWPKD